MDKSKSQREEQYDEMIKSALKRPGVREATELLQKWREIESEFAPHQMPTSETRVVTTTDSQNIR